ncbi:hypothetical protein Mgra_00005075 [Meloidogyne graminicola]|uniref:Uncharacterized protein n=1 Tax=Meloidogyne graminicola TaxID=189291 RepID=A0A8S9ZQP0_9BILA|nr:hypothetical protein Mgra_00005075 [Meloidogyne graminicola]
MPSFVILYFTLLLVKAKNIFISFKLKKKMINLLLNKKLFSIFLFCFYLNFHCAFAPGAHLFIEGSSYEHWGRSRDSYQRRLSTAFLNSSDKERERLANCMGNCYDADSNCHSCFAKCVNKCVLKKPPTSMVVIVGNN